ncbi:MAG: hypothetical protein Q9172_006376, partial [Xanthocarpia lactea]
MKVRPRFKFLLPKPSTNYSLQILESQSATLTNHEVLNHLTSYPRSIPSPSAPTTSPPTPTTTILTEVTRYLTSSAPSLTNPSSTSPLPPHLSSTQIQELVREMAKYKLTKAEVLMV